MPLGTNEQIKTPACLNLRALIGRVSTIAVLVRWEHIGSVSEESSGNRLKCHNDMGLWQP